MERSYKLWISEGPEDTAMTKVLPDTDRILLIESKVVMSWSMKTNIHAE